ncbi:MAG TPA: hypothetical protein VK054_12950, partial [Beutenbergiaceae bacterium]|nr:hypothetical protein [Beutenbergiaceae bacterium]
DRAEKVDAPPRARHSCTRGGHGDGMSGPERRHGEGVRSVTAWPVAVLVAERACKYTVTGS